jgi:nicotinamide-nucleotide amidase
MAAGATRVLGADVAVAVTGVGGPEPQDGHDPGTVCWAVNLQGASTGGSVLFEGSPAKVIESTVTMALEQLAFALANQM